MFLFLCIYAFCGHAANTLPLHYKMPARHLNNAPVEALTRCVWETYSHLRFPYYLAHIYSQLSQNIISEDILTYVQEHIKNEIYFPERQMLNFQGGWKDFVRSLEECVKKT